MACDFGTPKGTIFGLLGQFTIILSLCAMLDNQLHIKIKASYEQCGLKHFRVIKSVQYKHTASFLALFLANGLKAAFNS
jgi:hypothetical protein